MAAVKSEDVADAAPVLRSSSNPALSLLIQGLLQGRGSLELS